MNKQENMYVKHMGLYNNVNKKAVMCGQVLVREIHIKILANHKQKIVEIMNK